MKNEKCIFPKSRRVNSVFLVTQNTLGNIAGTLIIYGLCYFTIYNPMICNPMMHNSHINYTFLSEAVVQRCSVKKVFLEMSQNSEENTCARVSILILL